MYWSCMVHLRPVGIDRLMEEFTFLYWALLDCSLCCAVLLQERRHFQRSIPYQLQRIRRKTEII